MLGCETDEQKKALGPKLYKNLLALNNSISVLIEQEDPTKFAAVDGAKKLLELLDVKFVDQFPKEGISSDRLVLKSRATRLSEKA